MFDFCWSLFVRVKADFPAISDDLVNSYHLLLSCVDYIYANAVLAQRSDLLNDKTNIQATINMTKEKQVWSLSSFEVTCQVLRNNVNQGSSAIP